MVYSDDLWEFAEKIGGDMVATCRASNVEWEDGLWVVRAAHDRELAIRAKGDGTPTCTKDDRFPIAGFQNRKHAIEVEIQFFHELLPPTEGT